MKTKCITIAIFLCVLTSFSQGQEVKRIFLYIETGIDGVSCSAPDKDYIRAVSAPLVSDFYSDKIMALMMLESFGLKLEYRTASNKFGFSGGLRYTRMNASIGRESYMSGSPDFFYVNYNQSKS